MSIRIVLPLVLVLPAAFAPAAAQEPQPDPAIRPPVHSLVPGAHALSFTLLDGEAGELGYWRVHSPRTSLGLFVRLELERAEVETDAPNDDVRSETNSFALSVGPQVRRYLRPAARVTPFLYGSAELGYERERRTTETTVEEFETRADAFFGSLRAGVGLEWFPVPEVSVSGQTGLRLRAEHGTAESDLVDREDRTWIVGLDSFTSALSLNVYLP